MAKCSESDHHASSLIYWYILLHPIILSADSDRLWSDCAVAIYEKTLLSQLFGPVYINKIVKQFYPAIIMSQAENCQKLTKFAH